MKSIVVFCGSSSGNMRIYTDIAFSLGEKLAQKNIDLVYGGAQIGVMGAVANGALTAGGKVIGVLPHFLKTKEIEHKGVTEMILVETMHERKLKMHELSDGIITLPGGFGTMEEFFEVLTWGQLGLHNNPIGILNAGGFYNSLIHQINHMVSEGFLKPMNRKMLLIDENVEGLLEKMENYNPPSIGKWINTKRT